MPSSRQTGFDEPYPYNLRNGISGSDYDIRMHPGRDGWLPSIIITRDGWPEYHFVQSFDDIGTFTPGYAISSPPLTGQFWDFGMYSLPDDLPVPKWMPPAIERAGFRYDPVSNSERRRRDASRTHPDQEVLAV